MRALLDSHAFLWGIAGDRRMSQVGRDLFVGPSDLLLSLASVWELLIKVQVNKLDLPRPAGAYILRKMAENDIAILPINLDHLHKFEQLPLHHRDPFDRMLIAQGIEEDCAIITADPVFKKYSIRVIW
jgi:PIN domain nuclease of toxin-antitoxin system